MKIKSFLLDKVTWISVGFAIPFGIGFMYPELFYLQLPVGILALAFMPGVFAVAFSVNLAAIFVRIHKKFLSILKKHKSQYSYSFSKNQSSFPSSIIFAGRNVLYIFAISYAIISWTSSPEYIFSNPDRSLALAGLAYVGLMNGTILHVSLLILKKSSLMIENKKNGTKHLVSDEITKIFDFILSPILIISFAYSVITLSDPMIALTAILTLAALCLFSSFCSFYILKRNYAKKLMKRFEDKLEKIL